MLILKLKDEIGIINVAGEIKTVYDFVSQYQEIKRGSGKKFLIKETKKLKSFGFIK